MTHPIISTSKTNPATRGSHDMLLRPKRRRRPTVATAATTLFFSSSCLLLCLSLPPVTDAWTVLRSERLAVRAALEMKYQMFLTPQQQPVLRLSSTTTRILGPSKRKDDDSSRAVRVLGFAIDEQDEDTTQHRQKQRGYKNGDDGDDDDTLSPIDRHAWSQIFHSSSQTTDHPNNNNIMGSGWLLTSRQLRSMTGFDLRDACLERGIPAFGSAQELRESLQDWVREERKKTPSMPSSSLGFLQDYGSSSAESRVPDSLADWSRSVDLEPLLQRRRDIRSGKHKGSQSKKDKAKKDKLSGPTDFDQISLEEYLKLLGKAFQQSSSPYSNRDVQQLYLQAKQADQTGDVVTAKRTLMELSVATPRDARIFRRLARLERQSGNPHQARAILEKALSTNQFDSTSEAFLWHGLAQLQADDFRNRANATVSYQRAIACDPSLPHPYHALGTLQHQQGQIAAAMKTLKGGIDHCEPSQSHRLHHALGDVYRQAKVLDRAVSCYHKAAEYSPEVSRGFAFTALGHAYYEKEEFATCRVHLKQAVRWNPRQATAWVSLAQMEESVGQVDVARQTCRLGVTQYERNLLLRHHQKGRRSRRSFGIVDPGELKKQIDSEWSDFSKYRCLLEKLPQVHRSGDHFFHLYRTWARMEEKYGTIDEVEEVYERATLAFSWKPQLWVDWAQYYENLRLYDKARDKYSQALHIASAESARLAAQLEMKLGNYTGAREILYHGAQRASSALDQGSNDSVRGLAELLHTWAVCEWHSSDGAGVERAEILLKRVLDISQHNKKMRAYTHFTLAALEHYRGEDLLAQHHISLCLQEDAFPGGDLTPVWKLWRRAAADNPRVVRECDRKLDQCAAAPSSGTAVNDMQTHMMRRDPWHEKLFGTTPKQSNFYFAVRFPQVKQAEEVRPMTSE